MPPHSAVPTTEAEALIYHRPENKPEPLPWLRRFEYRAQVASAVREMRDRLGLSQYAFAGVVGLKVDDIEAIEDLDFNDEALPGIFEMIKTIVDEEPQ